MLKIFRNTRRSMLLKSKSGRYLQYAIGEIVLVVFGILIALQVNNWNETKKQRKEESIILKALNEEFTENLEKLAISKQRAISRKDFCIGILRQMEEGTSNLNKEKSDSLILGGLITHVTVDFSNAYLRELLLSGKIHWIQDPEVKKALLDWERVVGEIREDEGILFDERSTLVKPFLIKNYAMSTRQKEEFFDYVSSFNDYKSIYEMSELANLAINKATQYNQIAKGYDELEELIDEMIKLLNKNLND